MSGFSGAILTTDESHVSYRFMLEDLGRSGLTTDDLDVVALSHDNPPRYRIRYTESAVSMYRDRLKDHDPKYLGPSGVFDLWALNASIYQKWSSAKEKWVIEGEKKAACTIKYLRVPAIGIGGCFGYMQDREPMARIFDEIRAGDVVHLVLDGDITTNGDVGGAARRFAMYVRDRGAQIVIVNLGCDTQGRRYGFDDWIVECQLRGQVNPRGLRAQYNALPTIDPDTLPELRADLRARLDLIFDETANGNFVLRPCEENARVIIEDIYRDTLCVDQYLGPMFGDRLFNEARDDMEMLGELQRNWGRFTMNVLKTVRRYILPTNEINIVGDWLLDLKWDKRPRINTMFQTYCNASVEPDTYLHRAAYCLMLGAVARCLVPGTKFDYIFTLVGEQGTLKTTFWEALAGDMHGMPLCNNGSWSMREEDLVRVAHSTWFLNFDELVGLSKRDNESMKNWLTRCTDTWVPKWIEMASTRKRAFICVATTNLDEHLTDITGNRRHVPVTVGNRMIDIDALRRDREQLWAEAVNIYMNGAPEQWWVIPDHDTVQESHRVRNPWEEFIAQHLARTDDLLEVQVGPKHYHATTPFRILGLLKDAELIRDKDLRTYTDLGKMMSKLFPEWKKMRVRTTGFKKKAEYSKGKSYAAESTGLGHFLGTEDPVPGTQYWVWARETSK